MGAGGDIEEHHLISTLSIIAQSHLHRITDIAQSTLLSAPELHPRVTLPSWTSRQGMIRRAKGVGRGFDSSGVAEVPDA